MEYNFSEEVWDYFIKAGWYKGRNVKKIKIPTKEYANYPRFALDFLYEFGGLTVGETGAGINMAKVQIEFYPNRAKYQNEEDGTFRYYSDIIKKQLYPLGFQSDNYYLGIDADGKIYNLHDYCILVSDTLEKGLYNLLLGFCNTMVQLDEEMEKWITAKM